MNAARLSLWRFGVAIVFAALWGTALPARVARAEDPGALLAESERLLAAARVQIEGRAIRRAGVVPYLQDALATAAKIEVGGLDAPGRARLAYVRSFAHFLLGETAEAVAVLDAALTGDVPEAWRVPLLDVLARSHHAAGAFPEAAAAFQAAGNLHGAATAHAGARKARETAEAYVALLVDRWTEEALWEEARGAVRYAAARDAWADRLLQALPVERGAERRARWLSATAEALLDAERPQEAETLLREADLAAVPGGASLLGRALLAVDGTARGDDVLVLLMQALEADAGDEAARRSLWALASADYEALYLEPDGPRPVLERCLAAQRALVAADPEDAVAHGNLANTLRVAGRYEAALAAYELALELDESDPSLHSDRGLVLVAAGRPAEALAAFQAALERDGAHRAALQNAARVLLTLGRFNEARDMLARGAEAALSEGASAFAFQALLARAWRRGEDAAQK